MLKCQELLVFGAWKMEPLFTVSGLEAMTLVGVRHFVELFLSKAVLCPYPCPNSDEIWSESIFRGPSFFGINLRNMWTELKMDWLFSTKCLSTNRASFFGVQLSDISLTSKSWLEASSLVHEEIYNCLTVHRHQKPGWKPDLWYLEEDTIV